MEEDWLRVMVPSDVGGGFGFKGGNFPEYALLLLSVRRLKRPVRWSASRGEASLSDDHGRDSQEPPGWRSICRTTGIGNNGFRKRFKRPDRGDRGRFAECWSGAYWAGDPTASLRRIYRIPQHSSGLTGGSRLQSISTCRP